MAQDGGWIIEKAPVRFWIARVLFCVRIRAQINEEWK
jgi:hypothetical protein